MNSKKLYRSRVDKMIGGVAGGLADYFNVDPTIVRVLFVVSIFIGGGGVLAYIILWIVIPEEPFITPFTKTDTGEEQGGTTNSESTKSDQNTNTSNINFEGTIESARDNRRILGGSILIVLGGLFLLDNIYPRFDAGDYWPVVLIAIGVGIILKSQNN